MSLATNNWIARNRRRVEQEERIARREREEENARYEEWKAYQARRDALYDVPERAKDAYIAMEDDFGPETVKDFMNAMMDMDT